jgi:hypothetical protein
MVTKAQRRPCTSFALASSCPVRACSTCEHNKTEHLHPAGLL